MSVSFHKEDFQCRIPYRKRLVEVIKLIGLVEQKQIKDVNVVLVSDERLLEINRQYLNHDYYTDIITFQYPIPSPLISGDLFISVDRVLENSQQLKIDFAKEFARVVIHGVLHLCGYRDKRAVDKKLIRQKEDFYLDSMETL